MQGTVHEVYSHRYERNVFKGYEEPGYNACMKFLRKNMESFGYTLEYFMTEPEDRNWDDIDQFLPIGIWKDTTDQYSDEECDDDNYVEIPVPQYLLWQWYKENVKSDGTIEDMLFWLFEEYTCDETAELYYWLTEHNYFWKRID